MGVLFFAVAAKQRSDIEVSTPHMWPIDADICRAHHTRIDVGGRWHTFNRNAGWTPGKSYKCTIAMYQHDCSCGYHA